MPASPTNDTEPATEPAEPATEPATEAAEPAEPAEPAPAPVASAASSSALTIITTYFNFNQNPWNEPNTRHCVRQWRRAGARVIMVEFALEDAVEPPSTAPDAPDAPDVPFVFHPDIDVGDDSERHLFHTLVQHRVRDVMWYRETGFNLGLAHLPDSCTLVGLFDNDVVFVPPPADTGLCRPDIPEEQWWTHAIRASFQQNPSMSLLLPFQQVALSTESVRNAVLGVVATDATTPPPPPPSAMSIEDAVDKCEAMMRVRPSVMRDRVDGVVGCAWVVRRRVLRSTPLFAHTYMGGGDALMLNLWLGCTSTPYENLPVRTRDPIQAYYFHPESSFAKPLSRYRKQLMRHVQLPLRIAYLPCTLLHLYHGELATKKTQTERHQLWHQRRFRIGSHVISRRGVPGLFEWTQAFRNTGINAEVVETLERSHTVREKALLRVAKVHRCMETLREHVAEVLSAEHTSGAQEAAAHTELSAMMRQCLEAFGQRERG